MGGVRADEADEQFFIRLQKMMKIHIYILPPTIAPRLSDEQEDPLATHDIVMNIPKYFLTLLHAAAY